MNPFRTIWLQPRQTFENFIVNNEEQGLFALPFILLGFGLTFDVFVDMTELTGERKWFGLIISLPFGIGASFMLFSFIFPGLFWVTAKLWKGPATMRQLVNVYSISSIPYSLILINQLAQFLVGGTGASEQVNAGIQAILWLWFFSYLIIGVATVQRFSYGMALLNILLSQLPFLIIGLILT